MTTAVVTGTGVVAPNGLGTEEFWSATLRGENAITPIDRYDTALFPSRLAGQVRDFEAAGHLPSRLLPQTDRMTRFALTAADWALADAALDTGEADRTGLGVVMAAGAGGFDFGQKELQNLWGKGPDHVSAYMSFAWFYAVNTGQISIRHDLRGPTGVLVAEQAGGVDAIAQARRALRGGARAVLTGGMESSLCPYGMAARIAAGRLSTRDDPRRAYLPFDPDADGHVPGEGGAVLVLEDESRARARGATVLGEIAGYGTAFDPPPNSGRPGNLGRAAELALTDAGLTTDDVDVVFADADGSAERDSAEAETLVRLFGPYGVPVTAPKTMIGRLCSGGAPLDVVLALLALREGVIPPTTGVTPGHPLDLVRDRPRPFDGTTALVLARGNNGFNSALVLRGRGKDLK
ncbi:ketosynthase chain-length factor [Streptomyces swartbergensis]|uniref:Ketosynthase chain-length factor n=1 Tax=Streptomyces swartbergensis TaxID=487165 RepID=A0A2C9ZNN1_9ACTN|nr:ketosynthase chain-length factor [Streptomyces swartbergensis]OUD04961.1 ketosynthase chain-length factor [Streptomyces swartbergensis]